jgi:L-alanine-DL-glutamate epimerase-like enolase superfamily enzyme
MPVNIKKLITSPYNLELKSSLQWGKGHQLASLNHVLVIAELSDGSIGIAEATPRPTIYGETPESITAIIQRDCSELLIGQPLESVDDLRRADQRLAPIKNNNTAKGALNMALFSAYARSQNVSLSQLLNATQPAVRVSFILGTGKADEVMREADEVYAAGVRFLKVKVGKDFESETALIERIRRAYTDMDVYVDANECLNAEKAVNDLARLAEFDVKYCEEPLPVRQLRQRAKVRQESRVPLIADDSAFTLEDLERELDFDTFDILNIKTARTGFSHSDAMLRLSLAAGKGIMVGSQASSLLGCLHAIIFSCQPGIEHPTEGTFFLKVKDAETITINQGYVSLEQAEATLAEMQERLSISSRVAL